MIEIIVIGYGNVGSHLIEVLLSNTSINLKQVYNRSIEKIEHLLSKCPITNSFDEILEADVYIIAVSDDEISTVSKALKIDNKLVVHTSGSVDMNILNSNRKGVFYPLQTFTKNKSIDFSNIPLCIEANNDSDLILLEKLASKISNNSFILDSCQRKKMHLAAVFVNNFANHLYHIGYTICEENTVPFEILHPLMEETLNKIKGIPPLDSQTGPAKRNDQKTITLQLGQLSEAQQKIYMSLTNSIINTYKNHG
ncbi:Rossmann-like and DUF2520 domain-containing protein [Urechidicola vernalis]|uniref:DUF2520 domain-containing protein n=1 Tax=Urechidicola vernalis TaxID=3075600 RepID=A0ABU2Y274_9FLAO|nr:DUF2520 domain-containing protein [Urechidicola sp. P050]MDT0552304.1 DUF2520 domain-containing protein [Urechidicola sp. P050]